MTRPLTCIVIDDEPLALELLADYVARTPFLTLAGKYPNAVQALAATAGSKPDLAFVDIQMPEMDGLEFSRLADRHTKIVFTTAFDQYAIDGYKVNAVGYLLKPVSYADFLAAATKARDLCDEAAQPAAPSGGSIFVKSDYKLQRIDLDDITYIEGHKDYVRIHLASQTRPVTSLMSLKTMEDTLPPSRFMRVHRSFIVNKDSIRTVERGRIIYSKEAVPVGDNYKQAFQDFIDSCKA